MTSRTVEEVMSKRELVTIAPTDSIEQARRLTDEREISHLLVMNGRDLAGVVCICDFDRARVGSTVAECLGSLPTTVQPTIDVESAMGIMDAGGISCLPVLDGSKVVGVITRSDLRRAGLSERLGPEPRCGSCGTTRHVRAHDATGDVGVCLDCRRQSEPPHWTEDLGGGS